MYFLSNTGLQTFICCSMRKFENNEVHITRVCDSSVLILMFSGILRFTEDEEEIELYPNEYYIQRQGLFQKGIVPSDKPNYFYIHFDGVFSEEMSGIPLRGKFHWPDILSYVKTLEALFLSSTGNRFTYNGFLYCILGYLNKPKNTLLENENLLKNIEKYMMENFLDPSFSLKSVKKTFGFSEGYLIRIFKKKYKKTPYRFITGLRIEFAKQMIASTSRNLESIAYACGYSDYSVFYKKFTAETGQNPRTWRKKYRLDRNNSIAESASDFV